MWNLLLEKDDDVFKVWESGLMSAPTGSGATPEQAFSDWLAKAREFDDRLRSTVEMEGRARAIGIAHALIQNFDLAVHANQQPPISDSEYQRLVDLFGRPDLLPKEPEIVG